MRAHEPPPDAGELDAPKSSNQLGYYWAVVIPAIKELGYKSNDEAHRAMKAAYAGKHMDDPALPSLSRMSKAEMSEYLNYAIITAAEMGKPPEEPRT